MKRKDLKPGTVFRYIDAGHGQQKYLVWHDPETYEALKGKLPSAMADKVGGSHGDGIQPNAEVEVLWEPAKSETPSAKPPILTQDKAKRKEMPIARGVVDYFPRALAAIANVSYRANEQHNPGQPMHWARGKSTDHADCIVRHLVERGTVDDDGLRHSAKLAWRALALLETELELAEGIDAEGAARSA